MLNLFLTLILCSFSKNGSFNKPSRYSANMIIIIPPILPSHSWIKYDDCESIVFKSTPSSANTTENPRTKKRLLRNILTLADEDVSPRLVPERYAKKPGIKGRTHGLRNETIPPMNAAIKLT